MEILEYACMASKLESKVYLRSIGAYIYTYFSYKSIDFN